MVAFIVQEDTDMYICAKFQVIWTNGVCVCVVEASAFQFFTFLTVNYSATIEPIENFFVKHLHIIPSYGARFNVSR